MENAVILAVAMTLAAILGFAAHKAGICLVKAIAEIATSRRPFMLLTFAKTSAWSLLSIVLAGWIGTGSHFQNWPVTWMGITGGMIFGMGAGFNGGCVFSTLARLADGKLAMLAAVLAWPAGSLLAGMSFDQRILASDLPTSSLPNHIPGVLLAALLLWSAWEVLRLVRVLWKRHSSARLGHAPLTLSLAAMLIGASNGYIYHHYQYWSFTSAVTQSFSSQRTGTLTNLPIVWVLLASAFLGMLLSSALRGTMKWQQLSPTGILRHSCSGLAMGFGAFLIPGGNDALILYGVPSFSPHALPAIAGILIGIAVALSLVRIRGGHIPPVVCESDVCISG